MTVIMKFFILYTKLLHEEGGPLFVSATQPAYSQNNHTEIVLFLVSY